MDGSGLLPLTVPPVRPPGREIVTDSFAGGGGASTGIERALGRSPDVAINHDPAALAMHEANHPGTRHLISSIYAVDPADLLAPGERIGLAWFSPDCTHHSRAKGGKPVESGRRDLAHVVVHWAERVRPRVIMLENVPEFLDWGPLTADQRPDPERRGETFRGWVRALRRCGYRVEWQRLRACDYGAPTIRERLFLIARCDGEPIVWPAPTHAHPDSDEVREGLAEPWLPAASVIDWSLPCPSIFDTSAEIMAKHGVRAVRPLKDATLRRIARGVQRYVLDAAEPFCVTYAQHGGAIRSGADPLHTITASSKDQNAIVAPTLVQTGYGERPGQAPRSLDLHAPLGTVVAGGAKHALVAAFLAQHNAGPRNATISGRPATAPLATITTRGTQINLVAAHLQNMHGSARSDRDPAAPLTTVTAGGTHAALIAAFLTKYYGQGEGAALAEPCHTVTTRDRFGLVTVEIGGTPYAITDIGMRMLTPRELFRAQGFPETYDIDTGPDGRRLTKTEQVRMCGNSVAPAIPAALCRANVPELAVAGGATVSH
jgi:DNA (cytosine-5)-methyltransferase 1